MCRRKGIFGTGTCKLPLQVTTVIYHVHTNGPLGPQQNVILRGVPAVLYEEGRSVELYSGQVAIDVYSDTAAHALAAVALLRPANAPGSALESLPLPVYCPGLYGGVPADVAKVMEQPAGEGLPGQRRPQGVRGITQALGLSGGLDAVRPVPRAAAGTRSSR